MGDFIQNTAVKSAVRTLANPIADVAAFATIVDSVVSTNPFGCASYMTAGTTMAGRETKESYTAKIVYQDEDAKVVGNDFGKFNTVAGFNAGAAALLADTALAAAHGGTGRPGLRHRDLLGDPEVPRPERRDLHDHVRPGPDSA